MTEPTELVVEAAQGERYAEWFIANGYTLTISWMGSGWCVHIWHPEQRGIPYSNGATIGTALHHAYLSMKVRNWIPEERTFSSGSRY